MAGFRPDLSVRAYSGGTARDLHTIPYPSDTVPRRAGHCKLYCFIPPGGLLATGSLSYFVMFDNPSLSFFGMIPQETGALYFRLNGSLANSVRMGVFS